MSHAISFSIINIYSINGHSNITKPGGVNHIERYVTEHIIKVKNRLTEIVKVGFITKE